MSWLQKNKQIWRMSILICLIAAFLGPWVYERIHVPAEYACSPPFIRLEGDFCGSPIVGFQLFIWIIGGLFSMGGSLITGSFDFSGRIREALISLLMLFPLLSLLSTILLVRCGDQRGRQMFTLLAWISALGACLFLGSNLSTAIWFVWGIWLYIGLAICALIFEFLVFINRNNNPV